MFYHLNNGLRIISNFSKDMGIEYDAVVYLRADMHFNTRVEFVTPLPNTVYIPALNDYGGICDQMAYGTLDTMLKYAQTVNYIHPYFKRNHVPYDPEAMTLHNITQHGLQIVRFPLIASLDQYRHVT